jgi:hypothetical protein
MLTPVFHEHCPTQFEATFLSSSRPPEESGCRLLDDRYGNDSGVLAIILLSEVTKTQGPRKMHVEYACFTEFSPQVLCRRTPLAGAQVRPPQPEDIV